MSDPNDYDYDYPDDECGNCGGEGYTYDCIDGCCLNAEDGCELCARRCSWCNPPKPRPSQNPAGDLRQVLADALAKAKP